jgi:hypothetical protein
MNAARAGDKGARNCTEGPVEQEHVEEKGVRVSGLKVLGVFYPMRSAGNIRLEGGGTIATKAKHTRTIHQLDGDGDIYIL